MKGKCLHLISEFTFLTFQNQKNWKIQYEIITRNNSKVLLYIDWHIHSANTEHQVYAGSVLNDILWVKNRHSLHIVEIIVQWKRETIK